MLLLREQPPLPDSLVKCQRCSAPPGSIARLWPSCEVERSPRLSGPLTFLSTSPPSPTPTSPSFPLCDEMNPLIARPCGASLWSTSEKAYFDHPIKLKGSFCSSQSCLNIISNAITGATFIYYPPAIPPCLVILCTIIKQIILRHCNYCCFSCG